MSLREFFGQASLFREVETLEGDTQFVPVREVPAGEGLVTAVRGKIHTPCWANLNRTGARPLRVETDGLADVCRGLRAAMRDNLPTDFQG